MTEFLIYHNGWHIAHLSAISTKGCVRYEGSVPITTLDDILRAAWFERDGSFICFDADEPEVRKLPDV